MSNIVKNTTLVNLFDLFAPHSCRGCGRLGTPLCDCCKKNILAQNSNFCPCCKKSKTTGKCPKCQNLPPTYFIDARYGLLDTLIHDFKYQSVRALSPIFADLLNSRLPKIPNPIFIIPLPTATNHIRARGFDHTLSIAKHFAKLRHAKVLPFFLRTNNTVQVGANRQIRLTQAEQAFTINPKIKINQKATYILFDDVWTTGASMQTAIKKLRQAGASNIVIALLAVSRLD